MVSQFSAREWERSTQAYSPSRPSTCGIHVIGPAILSKLLDCCPLFIPQPSADTRLPESKFFLRRLEEKLGNGGRPTLGVECDVGKIARPGLDRPSGSWVLRLDSNTHLHRGPSHVVYRRLQYQEVADVDGGIEVHPVYGSR